MKEVLVCDSAEYNNPNVLTLPVRFTVFDDDADEVPAVPSDVYLACWHVDYEISTTKEDAS